MNNNKGRSTCVVCKKVRNQKFMHKLFDVWVCKGVVSHYDNTMIYLKNKNGYGVQFHKCSLTIIKRKSTEIESLKKDLNSNCVKLFGSLDNFTEEEMLSLT